MRKLIIIPFLLIALIASGQTVMKKKYRWFVPANGDTIDPLHDYGNSTTYHYNDAAGDYATADSMVEQTLSNEQIVVPDLPGDGLIEQGELYQWNGIIVRARQSHNRTIYDPTETLALFTIYRPVADSMLWIAGENVDIGMNRLYNGVMYECIQSHVTQEDWTPTATLNVLWEEAEQPGGDCPDWVQPTGGHDAYNTGDCVTFNGNQYESLINANVWSPSIYPQGWQLIE